MQCAEKQVLLYCCQPCLSAIHRARLKDLLVRPLNWSVLQNHAEWHGLLPILYYHLRSFQPAPKIPLPFWTTLERAYQNNTVRNLLLLEQLQEILIHLRAANLPVIVLKGAWLIDQIYPQIGLRMIADLDLLLPGTCVKQSESILTKLGYTYHSTNRGNHLSYVKDVPPVVLVEIHYGLVNLASPTQKYAFKVDLDEMWTRAQVVQIANVEALTFAPEDQLIYLCMHYFKEAFASLKWIGDLQGVLQFYQRQLDWECITHRSQQFGLSKIVYYTMKHLVCTLDVPIPREALTGLKPIPDRWLERKMFTWAQTEQWTQCLRFPLYLAVIDSDREKWIAFWKTIAYGIRALLGRQSPIDD
ncbi:MAG: nucleotidyltransferase family protein [Candidatus Poribacteria bacterium]|nr:nucleotidyltransferase family protein [Candidatus Poribacteria bacterium]